ncbi:MAG: hypothetical protein QNJ69_09960 [Gammaproteobacteria bacterium]|nr:hypothetical protein [Gammaproteobacteria bacterium]
MIHSLPQYRFFVLALAVLALSACEKVEQTNLVNQKNMFLQSILQVEDAGRILQSNQLTQDQIDEALEQMDRGLQQAFEVKRSFLQQLDERLPKLYAETFIPGVEQYRLGVESADRKQQLQGLNLLLKWSQYWERQRSSIKGKLAEMNG